MDSRNQFIHIFKVTSLAALLRNDISSAPEFKIKTENMG